MFSSVWLQRARKRGATNSTLTIFDSSASSASSFDDVALPLPLLLVVVSLGACARGEEREGVSKLVEQEESTKVAPLPPTIRRTTDLRLSRIRAEALGSVDGDGRSAPHCGCASLREPEATDDVVRPKLRNLLKFYRHRPLSS